MPSKTEDMKAYQHQYYLAHKDEYLERSSERNKLDSVKAYKYWWGLTHRDEMNDFTKNYRLRLKLDILAHYSRGVIKCAACDESDVRVLCIDHIDGNGAKQRRELHRSGGHGFYVWLKKQGYPAGYQVLCMNCNWKKRCVEYNLHSEVN